jgi:two-component system chemotaxis response regulator CheY
MCMVLVVDDEPTTREALCRALRRDGHEAVAAADAREAAARAAGRVPDVVLVDVNPGGAAGGGLVDAVCREPRWSAVPVVLLTSEPDARRLPATTARRPGPVRAAASLRQVMGCVRSAAARR